jgi:hypothetical protein
MKINSVFKPDKPFNRDAVISELVAAGIPMRQLITCNILRKLFTAAGLSAPPNSASTIKKIVMDFTESVKRVEKLKLNVGINNDRRSA